MSRYADVKQVLPKMIRADNRQCHAAIIQTFSDMLEEGWDDDDIRSFFVTGMGVSEEADTAIRKQLQHWGITV